MANVQTSASNPVEEPTSGPAVQDRFDQMYGRMKGTMKIVGNIVDPDSEDQHLNLYEDLRTRLRGTVTVLGEIVKSDPELWSDDR